MSVFPMDCSYYSLKSTVIHSLRNKSENKPQNPHIRVYMMAVRAQSESMQHTDFGTLSPSLSQKSLI